MLDTNVLLYNPRAIYAFPDADVIIPDIVLGELDKVKTSRADRELRYRSREISRILFELSENGRLTDGVSFGKNSIVRVMNFDPAKGAPVLSGSKNSDDRILSIVYYIKQEDSGRPVTIVTNDLNMLLKAQTLGIKVEHPGEEFAYSGIKRALFKLKAQKRAVWTAAGVAAVIALIAFFPQIANHLGLRQSPIIPEEGPPSLVKQWERYQSDVNALKAQIDTYETILKKRPKDMGSLVGIGNAYYNLGKVTTKPEYHKEALKYYKRALEIEPNNSSVRNDLAMEYYYLGMNDLAVSELERVIKDDKDYYQAYYNLGVIKMNDPSNTKEYFKNLTKAKEYFNKVVELTEAKPAGSRLALQARDYISQIDAQLEAHGDKPQAQ